MGSQPEEARRHGVGKPDAVVSLPEGQALSVHRRGIDFQDRRLAVAPADLERRFHIARKMHFLDRKSTR